MTQEQDDRYMAAAHAMQTGVAHKMHIDPDETTPKHLRVGVNVAMADLGSLARLLVAKGVITEDEYMEALCDGMEKEKDLYESWINEHFQAKGSNTHITLA